jgi:nucleotide-binding universal stress UspA family protein
MTCSVRVGRCPATAQGLGGPVKIVVAVDGSPDAAAAVEAVGRRTWPTGTEVQVATVLDLRLRTTVVAAGIGPWAEGGHDAEDDELGARRRVEWLAKTLREGGLAATPLLMEGDPKRVLIDVAEGWGADCIFLGAKGHSGIERFLLGSVSAAVAARAHCSVEVVRAVR